MLQILTDKNLHVIGDPTNNVYALGDCADIRDNPLPCIAQVTSKLRSFSHMLIIKNLIQ